jgi:hypothetical protein
VRDRLKGFVEPPSFPQCRRLLLTRRVLLIRGERGTGSSTAAFPLLRERCGADAVTGLDPDGELANWTPTTARGYLVQGMDPESADALSDVTLTALADRLRERNAYLVVAVERATPLPRGADRWLVDHIAPTPYDVARARLHGMRLTADQLRNALEQLEDTAFKQHLAETSRPAVGVDVAEELREVVTGARTRQDAETSLRLTGANAAEQTMNTVRADPDGLALAAAVSLLQHEDRSVVQRCATRLRSLIAARAQPDTERSGENSTPGAAPDVLGPNLTQRLKSVDAQLLPRVVRSWGRYRYWAQPVAFQGRHRAEAILERLWLDHEGIADLLLTWLMETEYQPGLDLVAGRAIGRVLRHATGAGALRQLQPLAAANQRWRRRLVAYALGEVAQDPLLSSAVREQLWQWGRQQDHLVRATVAETCAGSFGLARPEPALALLNLVLDGPAERMGTLLRDAVSFALGVLLTEDVNRRRVVRSLTRWLTEPAGTARRAYAVNAVTELAEGSFPAMRKSGMRPLRLAELVAGDPDLLLPLVRAGLADRQARDALTAGISALAPSPAARAFIADLASDSLDLPGVRSLLLTRHRALNAPPHGPASSEGNLA